MTLLSETRAAIAQLETMKRRRGIVTVATLRDALPPFLRNQASTAVLSDIATAINVALADADPVAPPAFDHQSRAAGDQA